jgi:hypothetical protein
MPEPLNAPVAVIVPFAMAREAIDERPPFPRPVPIPEPSDKLLAFTIESEMRTVSITDSAPLWYTPPVPMPDPIDKLVAVTVAFSMAREVIDERPRDTYPVPIPEHSDPPYAFTIDSEMRTVVIID